MKLPLFGRLIVALSALFSLSDAYFGARRTVPAVTPPPEAATTLKSFLSLYHVNPLEGEIVQRIDAAFADYRARLGARIIGLRFKLRDRVALLDVTYKELFDLYDTIDALRRRHVHPLARAADFLVELQTLFTSVDNQVRSAGDEARNSYAIGSVEHCSLAPKSPKFNAEVSQCHKFLKSVKILTEIDCLRHTRTLDCDETRGSFPLGVFEPAKERMMQMKTVRAALERLDDVEEDSAQAHILRNLYATAEELSGRNEFIYLLDRPPEEVIEMEDQKTLNAASNLGDKIVKSTTTTVRGTWQGGKNLMRKAMFWKKRPQINQEPDKVNSDSENNEDVPNPDEIFGHPNDEHEIAAESSEEAMGEGDDVDIESEEDYGSRAEGSGSELEEEETVSESGEYDSESAEETVFESGEYDSESAEETVSESGEYDSEPEEETVSESGEYDSESVEETSSELENESGFESEDESGSELKEKSSSGFEEAEFFSASEGDFGSAAEQELVVMSQDNSENGNVFYEEIGQTGSVASSKDQPLINQSNSERKTQKGRSSSESGTPSSSNPPQTV